MKVKVVTKFIDKHTGKVHKVGDVLTVSAERYEEILTVGPLVKKVETVKKAPKKEEKADE